MNIFATSADYVDCARVLDDRRVIKMTLETAQMLCTVMRQRGFERDFMYRPTHANHPCTAWIAREHRNFSWAVEHFFALAREYTFRFDKVHKSEADLGPMFNEVYVKSLPPLSFADCSGQSGGLDVFTAYRACLNDKWTKERAEGYPTRWTRRGWPEWLEL